MIQHSFINQDVMSDSRSKSCIGQMHIQEMQWNVTHDSTFIQTSQRHFMFKVIKMIACAWMNNQWINQAVWNIIWKLHKVNDNCCLFLIHCKVAIITAGCLCGLSFTLTLPYLVTDPCSSTCLVGKSGQSSLTACGGDLTKAKDFFKKKWDSAAERLIPSRRISAFQCRS